MIVEGGARSLIQSTVARVANDTDHDLPRVFLATAGLPDPFSNNGLPGPIMPCEDFIDKDGRWLDVAPVVVGEQPSID